MKNKLVLIIVLGIFLISFMSAEASYCCERTNSGAWCLNAPESECNSDYRNVPTSCEATSYCKLGVCINSQEGTCMPNTPQKVCNDAGGLWDEREKDEIPQCQLGCCLIGEQAAFVTQTRCKNISSLYGLEISYRTDIQNEMECISSARSKVKGACVYEREYEITCELLTKKECQEMPEDIGAEFHEGFLCSATELGTNCGPKGGTTCVEGRDEVYFLDTCGNLANVYDSSKVDGGDDDENYWTYITAPSCSDEFGNKDSKSCGDCNYYEGSTCKKSERGGSPDYGDYICKDLACYEDGEKIAEHGETWCEDVPGTSKIRINNEGTLTSTGEDLPGGRHFRMVCYNGEVSVEPCADFRQEVCIQSSIGDFKTATCRVNMWQDCYSQKNEKECENSDKRDCKWIKGDSFVEARPTGATVGGVIMGIGSTTEVKEKKENVCVPKHAPGFDFWEAESDAASMCSLANSQCIVFYTAGFSEFAVREVVGQKAPRRVSDYECVQECQAKQGMKNPFKGVDYTCINACPSQCVNDDGSLKKNWKEEVNDVCISMGDCGVKKNYIGRDGYHDEDASFSRKDKEKDGGDGGLLGGLGGLFG
ncbi:hypothetical protein KAJ87_02770 [Candidatus Pacearchaeota archaeon]|nr:hypothetical protein [Candidatus Pacearchaeota archaeon]